ncbi:MAG: mandelate racemase/muconate lactonizing enzyme family protein [Acidobacteria bacterium]|nr:mandelate racemase/muconate lactonizing enzyme family protein [Acidobacteriota bacterium]
MLTRRSLFALPLLAAAQTPKNPGRIRVTDVKVIPLKLVKDLGAVEPAWNPGSHMAIRIGGGSFVEIHTSEGITGIGPGMDPALLPAVKAQLVGKDPFDTEQHMARLRYYAAGTSYRGAACVDVALWDVIGKACGQPLYKLWGGAKEKVPAYASMIKLGTPEERAALAGRLAAEGWKAIKLRLHHETMRDDLRTVELVRKAVGGRMVIMTDANQAQSSGNWQPGVLWDYKRALETARELHRMEVYWLEEPLPRFAWDQLSELNRNVDVPLAGGENNRLTHEFLEMCKRDVYDILQPEGMVMEGLTALRKIGALAEFYGKKIVPHHGGGDIGTVAHLHVVASWTHAPYFEILHDPPVADYRHRFSIMKNPPQVDGEGMIAPPPGPGLGVEIDPALRA